MKLYATIGLATALALVACGGTQPGPVGGGAAPEASTDAIVTKGRPAVATAPSAPRVVEETKVTTLSAEDLARAQWTRHGCSLDTVDGQADAIVLERGQPHVFRGYLVDDAQAPAGSFQLVLKGPLNYAIPAATGWARPDVAEFFKLPVLSTSGFEFSTTLDIVPPGDYQVLFLIGRGERLVFCESDKAVTVR